MQRRSPVHRFALPARRVFARAIPALLAVILAGCVVAAVALGAFSRTTSNTGNSVKAKRIFPGTSPARTTSSWVISDAADGSAASVTDGVALADGTLRNTSNWTNAFGTTRFITFDFMGGLPASVPVTGVTFDFNFMPNAGGNTGCFYFEVIQTSTGSVLSSGTHGSAASPISPCATGTSTTNYSVPLTEITSSDQLNDLSVKVYGRESGGRPFKIDLVRISGNYTYGGTFQRFAKTSTDTADGSASTAAPWGAWGAASVDTTNFQTGGNWATTFNAARLVQVTFPTYVPSGATITGVTFTNRYRSNGAAPRRDCFYYEAWSGATPLQTYGSTNSATPTYCSDTLGNWQTDAINMTTEVNTPAKANGLIVKMYGFDSGGTRSNHDQITLTVDYYLD